VRRKANTNVPRPRAKGGAGRREGGKEGRREGKEVEVPAT